MTSAGDDQTVRLWDVDAEQELAVFRGHESGVVSLAFSPDAKRLASGDKSQTVRIWDASHDPRGVSLLPTGSICTSCTHVIVARTK